MRKNVKVVPSHPKIMNNRDPFFIWELKFCKSKGFWNNVTHTTQELILLSPLANVSVYSLAKKLSFPMPLYCGMVKRASFVTHNSTQLECNKVKSQDNTWATIIIEIYSLVSFRWDSFQSMGQTWSNSTHFIIIIIALMSRRVLRLWKCTPFNLRIKFNGGSSSHGFKNANEFLMR